MSSTTSLRPEELAALDEYKNDLVDMGRQEIMAELRSVQDLIDIEISWAEALAARLKQMELEA